MVVRFIFPQLCKSDMWRYGYLPSISEIPLEFKITRVDCIWIFVLSRALPGESVHPCKDSSSVLVEADPVPHANQNTLVYIVCSGISIKTLWVNIIADYNKAIELPYYNQLLYFVFAKVF